VIDLGEHSGDIGTLPHGRHQKARDGPMPGDIAASHQSGRQSPRKAKKLACIKKGWNEAASLPFYVAAQQKTAFACRSRNPHP
jgi:hypothetical protein